MNELNWMSNHQLEEVNRLDYQWVLKFDKGVSATIECMWRLIENGRIRMVNLDDGQQFGQLISSKLEHRCLAARQSMDV